MKDVKGGKIGEKLTGDTYTINRILTTMEKKYDRIKKTMFKINFGNGEFF